MNNKKHFSARTLRSLLLVCIALFITIIIGGFIYAYGWLSDNANDTKTKSYTNVSGNLPTNEIVKLQDDVNSHRGDSIKATELVTKSQNYTEIANKDLNKYAADIGISIANFGVSQKPSYMTTDVQITGVTPQFITISFTGPIPYTKLLEFINAIESNIPKMKITGINIENSPNQDGSVLVKPIIIEVYTE